MLFSFSAHTGNIGIMKVIILLSLVAVAVAIRECGENSHYDSCGTACPVTCKNRNNPPKVCVLMCKPGCHCDEGYVKSDDGRCVAPEECPAEPEPQEVCGENQVFETCGTACPMTCDNYQNPPKFCTLQCVIGCACAKGFVKTREGRCVRPEQCPASNQEVCGENQVFETCGTACPLTCDNYQNPPKICTMQCVIGCACAKGFVKTRDGRCVRPEQCPASTEEECGENQVFENCGTACPLTCDNYQNPPKICTLQCVIGCGCELGFVRARDGRCVRPEQCPASAQFLKESATDLCELPPETGPCRALFPRYYFDKSTGQCKKFIYGGCLGNSNNFRNKEDCEAKCGKSA